MNSQIASDVISGSSKWEDGLLDLLSEYQNNHNEVTSANVPSTYTENGQEIKYQNTSSMEYTENQVANFNNVHESTTLLSPSWEEQPIAHQTTNMSTYFSTFNPTQVQTETQQYSVGQKRLTQQQSRYSQYMEKSHLARINAVASSGIIKKSIKRKRKRTVFTTEQVEALELVFAKKPYITREDRQILVQQLQLSDKSVKIWFQNRRLKGKREDSEAVEDVYEMESNRLDYVESKINERTNEFGYVTLDDKIMSDLVSLIDDYLTKPAVSTSEMQMEVVSPIYEPISPASTIEEHSMPAQNDSIQRLVDIESIISV